MIIKDIRPVIPRQYSPGRNIYMTRNVMATMRGLSGLQINCIVAVVDAVQPSMVSDMRSCMDLSDRPIPVPFSVIGGGRDRERMYNELIPLLDIKVRYALPVPGMDSDVTTCLVSSIIRQGGQFFVTIPATAMPIYLYLGQTVGYAQIERDILLSLPSANQKILHMLLCEKIDAKRKCGTLHISPTMLAEELGLPASYRFPQLRQNVILPYIHNLDTMGSRISVQDIYDSDMSDQVGRHPITSIKLIAGPRQSSQETKEAYTIVYSFVSRYIGHLADSQMSAIGVCEQLEAQGQTEDFASRMNRYHSTHQDAVARHTANVMRTILRKDYQIDI